MMYRLADSRSTKPVRCSSSSSMATLLSPACVILPNNAFGIFFLPSNIPAAISPDAMRKSYIDRLRPLLPPFFAFLTTSSTSISPA